MNRAVFLDRDGTINLDKGYVYKIDDFVFFPGVIDTLKKIKEKGYMLVIITNQSGIARGLYTEDDFFNLTEWMDWSLADRGVDIDGIYYCPHHPNGSINEYKTECNCRKPNTGMIETAKKTLNLDLEKSFIIADKISDIIAGEKSGIRNKFLIQWKAQTDFDLNQNRDGIIEKNKEEANQNNYTMIQDLAELLVYL